MQRKGMWLGLSLVLLTGELGAAQSGGDLAVHEWGTFLVMQGSDGATLDGMYHEEHALPQFVHARSRDQLRLPSALVKGETPVIYFYTGRAQNVRVRVGFPEGIWTQWYPQASFVGPQLANTPTPLEPRDGHITWNTQVIPSVPGRPGPALPEAGKDALWNFAREVDAAYVKTTNRAAKGAPGEYERFLFYRGLGRAPLPLRMTTTAGGTLAWSGHRDPLRHLFVLRVENGKGVYRYLPELAPDAELSGILPPMSGAQPLPAFTRKVADDLAARLTASGLYPKEARAMVNTWSSSYFQTEGIRVLFVLPQSWTDEFIPMTLDPQPRELVRVMVGRLELLSPEREQRAERAVRDLASQDARTRQGAYETLCDQGRYVEPILRRVLRTAQDERVRTLCKRLLLTDFVTELRAAVHSASNGERVVDKPVHVRAQLVSLLREIGLDTEAKAEAEPVLAALRSAPAPPITTSIARHYLRAYARATEGLGDDGKTAAAYGQLIRFGSQVKTCGGCHDAEGPRDMAWFRDWWAGRKFAEYVARAGRTEDAIAEGERTLAGNPGDTAAQMRLAYLYAARGQSARAETMWAKVAPPAPHRGRTANRRTGR